MNNKKRTLATLALSVSCMLAHAANPYDFEPLSYWQAQQISPDFSKWGAPQTCSNVIWSQSDKIQHTVMLGAQIVSGSPQIAFYDSDNDAQYQATGVMNVVSSWTAGTTLTKTIRDRGSMTFALLPDGFYTSNSGGSLYRRGCF